jgi:hypothetical protein
MATLENGGPNAQLVDPKTGKPNSQYLIVPPFTAQGNWDLVAAYNQITLNNPTSISSLPIPNSYYVYEHDFTILELEALSPGGGNALYEAWIGEAPENFLGYSVMQLTNRNRLVLNSNCQPVTSYPTQY